MVYIVRLSVKEPVSDMDPSQENFPVTKNQSERSSSEDSFSDSGNSLSKESHQDFFPEANKHSAMTISPENPLHEINSLQNLSISDCIFLSESSSSSQDHFSVGKESLLQLPSQGKVLKNGKPFICDICQKGFNFKSNFDRHRFGHVRIEKEFCNLCQRTFHDRRAYKRHSCIKNGKKNAEKKSFECNVCDQKFSKHHIFLCHLEKHNQKPSTPLICEKCEK